MELITSWNLTASAVSIPPMVAMSSCFYRPPHHRFSFTYWTYVTYPFPNIHNRSHIVLSRKRNPEAEPVLKPSIVEEVSLDDEEDQALFDDFEDGKDPFTLSLYTHTHTHTHMIWVMNGRPNLYMRCVDGYVL
jgi:hypothetical protein